MRIKISQKNNSIPLLPEIPSLERCRIEGRNGIGKTLTVRLLQLATGDQPYRAEPPLLWQSLRSALGLVTIEITELNGANQVLWQLDPSRWPDTPEMPIDKWDGFEVSVDGRTSSITRIRDLLAILRLDGSETVRDTIVARIRDVAGQLRLAADRLRPISDSYASPLESMRNLTSGINGELVSQLTADFRASRKELSSTQESLLATRHRTDLLNEAKAIAGLLGSGVLAAAQRDRDEIDREIERLQLDINRLREEAARLVLHSTDSLRDAIKRHEQTVKRTTTRLSNQRQQIERIAERLRVDPEPQAVSIELREALKISAELAETRRSLGDLPVGLDIGRAVEDTLITRTGKRLDVSVATISGSNITAGQLKAGILEFREWATRQVALDLAQLSERINETNSRITSLRELASALDDIPTLQRNLSDARARLEEKVRELEETDERSAFEANLAQTRELSDRIGELNERRGHVTAQLARLQRFGSEEEMLAKLNDLLATLATTIDQVEGLLEIAFTESGLLSGRVRELEAEVQRTGQKLDAVNLRVRSISQAFLASEFDWCRDILGEFMPRIGEDPVIAARELARLDKAVGQVDRSLDTVRSLIDGAPAALDQLGESIDRNDLRVDSSSELRRAAQLYFERIFAAELSQDRIAEELFEGAGSLDFDLERMEVSWSGRDGERRMRPLEAFSSGERAWTYTLARLHNPVRQSQNRLLVLDEFGAFIEAEKLAALERTLRDRIPGEIADQLVLVLPLTYGWDQGVGETEAERRRTLVERDGYFWAPMSK